ncbi:L-gulonolactone oxidase 3 [Ananas comosus]|uniref:L-gulonolactone oxidase 3 n=1 Tax=Ananas comosus TaxID=4615 RepID=A0A199V7F2_ANACO|nr:L-gulonolactone oxidase 3 [Ananas comosus]
MTLVLILGFLLLQFLLLLLSPPHAADSLPPASPIRCDENAGCVVSNAYGAWNDADRVPRGSAVYPTPRPNSCRQSPPRATRKPKSPPPSPHLPKLACPQPAATAATQHYFFGADQHGPVQAGARVRPADRTVTASSGGAAELIDAAEERG